MGFQQRDWKENYWKKNLQSFQHSSDRKGGRIILHEGRTRRCELTSAHSWATNRFLVIKHRCWKEYELLSRIASGRRHCRNDFPVVMQVPVWVVHIFSFLMCRAGRECELH